MGAHFGTISLDCLYEEAVRLRKIWGSTKYTFDQMHRAVGAWYWQYLCLDTKNSCMKS